MGILDILRQTGGVDAIARELNIPPALAEAGATALLPAVLGGFRKTAEGAAGSSGGAQSGLGGLIDMIGGLGGAGLVAQVLGAAPTDPASGNGILGQIFGSKDVSRAVAGDASGRTGIDPELLKRMLPLLAMLVGGYLSHHGDKAEANSGAGSATGGLGGILASVFGGGKPGASGAGGGLGSLVSMLDMDGDGNPLDDIIGMAGKLVR